MTTYKCKACGGHWAEGVTRDHQEDQECRACAVERVNLLTVFYKSAMDRSECLERMAKDLSGELEAEVVETDALRKRLVDASRTIHNLEAELHAAAEPWRVQSALLDAATRERDTLRARVAELEAAGRKVLTTYGENTTANLKTLFGEPVVPDTITTSDALAAAIDHLSNLIN